MSTGTSYSGGWEDTRPEEPSSILRGSAQQTSQSGCDSDQYSDNFEDTAEASCSRDARLSASSPANYRPNAAELRGRKTHSRRSNSALSSSSSSRRRCSEDSSSSTPRAKFMTIADLPGNEGPDPSTNQSMPNQPISTSIEHHVLNNALSEEKKHALEEKAHCTLPEEKKHDSDVDHELFRADGCVEHSNQEESVVNDAVAHGSGVVDPSNEALLADYETIKLPTDPARWRTDQVPGVAVQARTADFRTSYHEQASEQPASAAASLRHRPDELSKDFESQRLDVKPSVREMPNGLREAWECNAQASDIRNRAAAAQEPIGSGLEPVGGCSHGFGGARGPLAVGFEAQLVDQLAERFVLDRKAPLLEKRERMAYKEMLQQVSWNALEPTSARETSLLLSRRWLAPVSSTEALRAFRRCLHSILCDDRVLDIVEMQMAAHFSRRAGVQQGSTE